MIRSADGDEKLILMKNGIKVDQGSKEFTWCEVCGTVWQMIAWFNMFILLPTLLVNTQEELIPIIIFTLFLTCFSVCIIRANSKSTKSLDNILSFVETIESLITTLETPAELCIIVQNYHYERRTSGSGKNRRTR